jgi:sugar phosphate isomerase/epimerase
MPREKRDALMREREIVGFLEQSHISPKNLARLRALGRSENTRIADLAHLVLDVGAATPYRRRRIRILARERRDILKRMEEAGLIMPLPPREDMDPYDIDPVAAWYEWVEYARTCGDE